MGWWKDDPDLARYYGEQDRAYAERRAEIDIALIRGRADIEASNRRIAAAEQAEWRARRRRFTENLRDSTEHTFDDCDHFDEAACRRWADETHRIFRTAIDDHDKIQSLLTDFRRAAAALQCDLRGIAELLSLELAPVDAPVRSPLAELLREFGVPTLSGSLAQPMATFTTDVSELRYRTLTCAHLRARTRHEWLSRLRAPPIRPTWPIAPWPTDELPADAVLDLRQRVTLESRHAGLDASLLTSSLELLATYT
ncbi:hypothetical protein [Nocardia crassostreae]|uniref:hypothetical protein n=1 Tax=Nocardia crassostreae TaxID=53428 RepID=UPI00082F2B98|nr:hypothetical protein [Nocardia crassostreae]